ncbi:MAG: EpsG family protein [Treponema sp.]|nr:EpsG family protein [Treponema sp.]
MFYLVLYALFFVVAVCNYYSFRKNEIALSNVLYYGCVFLLFIVGAFRFETGGDWPGYKLMYDELSGEPLFRTIIYIAHVFGHYQYIFVLTELIRFAILIYIIDSQFKSAPQYKMLFVLLYYSMYFFYYDMVIVRQTTAAIVFAYGVFKNRNGNFKTYLFWAFLAAMFHFSALMLLFMYYPLYRISNKKFTIFNYFIIACYFLGFDLFGTVIVSVLEWLPHVGLIYKLWAYTQIADLATARNITGQSLVYLLSFFTISYLHIFKKRPMNSVVYNGVCLYMFFYIGLPAFSTISTRLSTFYSIFVIFAILEIIKAYRKLFFIPLGFVFLCFCFNKGIFFESSEKVAYNPYQFYFTYDIFGTKSTGEVRLNQTRGINIRAMKKEGR